MRRSLLLAVVLTAALVHAVPYALPFEDSFITFRYAEHLAAGEGLVWNPGERVEGCSSFAWTVILAAVARMGIALPGAAVVLSLLAGLVLVMLTRELAEARGVDPIGALVAAALVAAHGTFAYFAASGMETALFAALVCLAVLVLERGDPMSDVLAGVVLGVSTWVRPEGFGYVALSVLATFSSRDPLRRAQRVLLPALLLAVPLVVFRLSYFGYPVPNTSYAKATPTLGLLRAGAAYALDFTLSTGFVLVAVAFERLRRRRALTFGDRLALVLAGGAFLNAVFVGGDTFSFFRTFLPAIGPAAVLTVRGLGAPGAEAAGGRVRLVIPALAVVWALAASFVPRVSLAGVGSSDFAATRSVARMNADYFLVGRFLRDSLPTAATIAVNAAGIVPYVSGLRTIDMLGLNDEHIAHHPVPREPAAVGHEKHDARYVLGRRPDVILPGLPVLSRAPLRPDEIGNFYARYARYLPGDRELFSLPELAALYTPVVVPLGDGYLPMFVRRSGVR